MSTQSLKKFSFIDALRGWAILLVILVHSGGCVPNLGPKLGPVVSHGARGVQLFYIVSALTLFLSFESRLRHESRPVLYFFIRRLFRIAPLFYVVLLVYFSYSGKEPKYWSPAGVGFYHYLSAVTFTNGWFPSAINMFPGGWSIAVETNFYIILPLLFFVIRSLNRAILFTIVALFVAHELHNPLLNFYLPFYQPQHQYVVREFMGMYLFSQIPVFSLGLILFFILKHVVRDKIAPTQEQVWFNYKRSLTLLAVSAFVIYIMLHVGQSMYFSTDFTFGLAFLCLVWALAIYPHKLFVNPFTIFVGKVSYSAYLLHFMVLTSLGNPTAFKIMTRLNLPMQNAPLRLAVIYGCTLFFTLVASTLTYFLVELPTQKLGSKIIDRMESSRQQAAVQELVAPVAVSETSGV